MKGFPSGYQEPVAYRWRVKGDDDWTLSTCKIEFDARSNDDWFETGMLYAEPAELMQPGDSLMIDNTPHTIEELQELGVQVVLPVPAVDDRAEFEKWYLNQPHIDPTNLYRRNERYEDGDGHVNSMWEGWSARGCNATGLKSISDWDVSALVGDTWTLQGNAEDRLVFTNCNFHIPPGVYRCTHAEAAIICIMGHLTKELEYLKSKPNHVIKPGSTDMYNWYGDDSPIAHLTRLLDKESGFGLDKDERAEYNELLKEIGK